MGIGGLGWRGGILVYCARTECWGFGMVIYWYSACHLFFSARFSKRDGDEESLARRQSIDRMIIRHFNLFEICGDEKAALLFINDKQLDLKLGILRHV